MVIALPMIMTTNINSLPTVTNFRKSISAMTYSSINSMRIFQLTRGTCLSIFVFVTAIEMITTN